MTPQGYLVLCLGEARKERETSGAVWIFQYMSTRDVYNRKDLQLCANKTTHALPEPLNTFTSENTVIESF